MPRAYLPLTPTLLRRAVAEGRLAAGPAHAVTDAVVEVVDGDQEEQEYAAMTAAVEEAASLLRDDEPAVPMVAAVDVLVVEPDPERGPSAVTVPATELRRLASVHVGEKLLWYAAQEVGPLLDGLGATGTLDR